MKEPSWTLKVKIRDNYTCKFCGEGTFDHEFVDAHHIKPKKDYHHLAEVVENGETLCMLCHIKEHYKRGDWWSCVLIIFRLLYLMMKRARWPIFTFKDYSTVRALYHECSLKGFNYSDAAQILQCSESTIRRRLKKIKRYFPHIIDQKGRIIYQPLPPNWESHIKQQL